ncbi:MAG: HAD family hydrolase, partial [Clostridia bacterium]
MIPDNIEAYIFDLDGTLIDSNGVWKEIDRLIFEKNNVCLSDTELNAAAAMNYSDFLGFLRSYGIVYTLDELKSELDGYAVIKYSSEIKLKSGVKEYLDKLKKAGKKIFLATASPEKLYAPV